MQELRNDQFIVTLQQLGQIYPEYASFLKFVIQLFKQRQAEGIDSAIERLKNEEW